MVRCMLALVQELKASDLTQAFCQHQGISYSATLHCREELENYEELQDRIEGVASSSELHCIIQKQGKGLQKLQHFLLRLHCLSFQQTQETSCDEGQDPPSSHQGGSGEADAAHWQQSQENGWGQTQVKVKKEVLEENMPQVDRGDGQQEDKQSVQRATIEVDRRCAYSCAKCCMNFRSKLLLRKHLRTHSGERPFLCPHCPHQANRRDNMRTHCLLMHGLDIRRLPKEEVRNPNYKKPERKIITANMEPVVVVKQEMDDDDNNEAVYPHHLREREEGDTAATFDFAVPDMDNTNDSSSTSHSINNNINNNTSSQLGYSLISRNILSQYHHSVFGPSSSISSNHHLVKEDDEMDTEQQSQFNEARATAVTHRSSPVTHTSQKMSRKISYTSQRGGDFACTKSRRHFCDYCNYSSLEVSLMKRHVLTKHRHEPRHQLFCPLCSFVTLQRTRYNEHMDREHTSDEGRYACNKCSYTSMHKSNLYRHLNTHKRQPRQLRCPLCPYVCSGNLGRHIRSQHSSAAGGAQHQCPDCTFRTWYVDKYQAHLNSHAGQNKYTCEGCSWSTYYKKSFDQHMELYHRGNWSGEQQEQRV